MKKLRRYVAFDVAPITMATAEVIETSAVFIYRYSAYIA